MEIFSKAYFFIRSDDGGWYLHCSPAVDKIGTGDISTMSNQIKIISIDPGRTTGFCYAILNTDTNYIAYYPFQAMDDVDEFWARLEAFNPRYIIMESFEFRQKARVGLDMFPVQLIGIARLYELHKGTNVRLFFQTAMKGKGYYSDTILKRRGYYIKAKPHAMDASRHLLQWLTFEFGSQFKIKEPYILLDKWE